MRDGRGEVRDGRSGERVGRGGERDGRVGRGGEGVRDGRGGVRVIDTVLLLRDFPGYGCPLLLLDRFNARCGGKGPVYSSFITFFFNSEHRMDRYTVTYFQ